MCNSRVTAGKRHWFLQIVLVRVQCELRAQYKHCVLCIKLCFVDLRGKNSFYRFTCSRFRATTRTSYVAFSLVSSSHLLIIIGVYAAANVTTLRFEPLASVNISQVRQRQYQSAYVPRRPAACRLLFECRHSDARYRDAAHFGRRTHWAKSVANCWIQSFFFAWALAGDRLVFTNCFTIRGTCSSTPLHEQWAIERHWIRLWIYVYLYVPFPQCPDLSNYYLI